MKPCPYCGEHIQDAAAKCRFCFEWLDPTKRPSWSSDEQPPTERSVAAPLPTAPAPAPTPAAAVHEVARPAELPHARVSAHEREVSRPKPIASMLEQPLPSAARPPAAFAPPGMPAAPLAAPIPAPIAAPIAAPPAPTGPRIPPMVATAGPEPARALGQPAPRPGARWQPGEDSGPKATAPVWQAPEPEPEPEPEVQGDPVWTPPNWLLGESKPAAAARAPAVEAPSWAPPPASPPPQAPVASWGPSPSHAPASVPPVGAPAWTPPDHTPIWSPRQAPIAIDDDEFEEPLAPVRASAAPAHAPAASAAEARRRRGLIHEPLERELDHDGTNEAQRNDVSAQQANHVVAAATTTTPVILQELPVAAAAEPVAKAEPKAEPKPAAKPKAKAKRDDDDDDDFDDDDDDDDDDDGDEETGSMPAMSDQAMSAAARKSQPRKLPWVAIAGVSSVLVLVLAFVFKDAIFGGGDETDESAESGAAVEPPPSEEPAKTEPTPEPTPDAKTEPLPEAEPPPPAIDPTELEDKLSEADSLYRKAKHEKAREILDEVLAKAPKEPRALALLAQVLLEKGEFETALTTANDCVAVNDQEANCWMTIAVIEQENKNFPRALEGYRKYLEIDPAGRFATSAKKQVTRLESKVAG